MENCEKLGASFVGLIENSSDFVAATSDGVLNHLGKGIQFLDVMPIGSMVLGVAKLNSYLTIRKWIRFIRETDKLSSFDKITLIEKKFKTQPDREKIGIFLLNCLEQIDVEDKTEIIARLFVKYLRGRIDISDFRKCCRAVNQVDIESLQLLSLFSNLEKSKNFGEEESPNMLSMVELESCGLIRVNTFDGGRFDDADYGEYNFRVEDFLFTPLGRLIFELRVID